MNVYIYAHQYYEGRNIFLFGDSRTRKSLSLSLVGSVPTCLVASHLWKEHKSKAALSDKNPAPVGGVILQSAIYSGATALIGGCFLRRRDPYNNAAEIPSIAVRMLLFLHF